MSLVRWRISRVCGSPISIAAPTLNYRMWSPRALGWSGFTSTMFIFYHYQREYISTCRPNRRLAHPRNYSALSISPSTKHFLAGWRAHRDFGPFELNSCTSWTTSPNFLSCSALRSLCIRLPRIWLAP